MKRSTISLMMAMLTVCSVSARQISPDEAMTVASDLMNSSELHTVGSSKSLKPMLAPGVNTGSVESPYYVFNRGEADGFVIISGDDRAPKILGYSDKGSFDAENMPPQLKAMMEQWAIQMTKLPESLPQHASWKTTTKTRAGEEVLLETANWGQNAPYNANTPIIDDEHCPTGCVATAMAIVMKYHNWPENFNWDSMPKNTTMDPLDYEVSNASLAELMTLLGESVYMEYNLWESGANMNWVGHKMQQEYKYSPDCQFITSANFSHEEWIGMLKSNIDGGYPVIYTGSGSGSHAFIVDGYSDLGYHINWGWDGFYNGYFSLDALTPNEYQDFSQNTGMVINIIPDKSGNVYSKCFTDAGYFWATSGAVKMNISVEEVRKGEPFSLANSGITVFRGFNGLIGLAIVDKEDKIKEVLGAYEFRAISEDQDAGPSFALFNVIPTVDVESTDRIQLVSKDKDDTEFRLVLGTLEWPSYVGVTNNHPRFSKIHFEKAEDTELEFFYGDGDKVITKEEEEREVLTGVFLGFQGYKKNLSPEKVLVAELKGHFIYGDSQTLSRSSRVSTSFDVIEDEYYIGLRTVEVKEEAVQIEKAGTLKDLISEKEAVAIKSLTIEGRMNAFDFWHIRKYFCSLEYLDLRKVSIEGVFAADGGFIEDPKEHASDYIPAFALNGLENLKTLYLPEGIKGIDSDALGSLGLRSVTIPVGVEFIGLNEFFYNKYLQNIELLNPEPVSINDCVFTSTPCPIEGTLYVPVGSSEKYRQTPVWQDFKEIVEGRMPLFTTKIELSATYKDLTVGETFKIEASVNPENASNGSIVWVSDDLNIAAVDSDGNVTGISEGTTLITATAADGSGISASCAVTVEKKMGDSNGDGIINVSDAVNVANYIVNLPTTNFDFESSDMNSDGEITVSDITSIISLIPDQSYVKQAESGLSLIKSPTSGYLISSASSINSPVDFSLVSDEDMTALQFDLQFPASASTPVVKLADAFASSHTLQTFNVGDNTIRIVVYSPSGKLLTNTDNAPILKVSDVESMEDLNIYNIFASDTYGASHGLDFEDLGVSNAVSSSSITTPEVKAMGSSLIITNAAGRNVSVYSLDGTRIGSYDLETDRYEVSMSAGLYIVTVGNHSHRVIIK